MLTIKETAQAIAEDYKRMDDLIEKIEDDCERWKAGFQRTDIVNSYIWMAAKIHGVEFEDMEAEFCALL